MGNYWRFEGPAAADVGVPGGNPGTVQGNVTFGLASASAALGKAALFGGEESPTGSLLDVGVFHPGDAVTVECWVRLDVAVDAKSYHSAVARWDGSYEIDVNGGSGKANFVARNDANAFVLVESQQAFTSNEWHHMVGVFAGGAATVYLDGAQGTTASVGGVLRDGGHSVDRVLIGATRGGSGPSSYNWSGAVDEVAVYARALSAGDVARHFAAR